MNNFNFDNTLKVKQFAESSEAVKILNEMHLGNEVQLYNIGQEIYGTGYGFSTGTIIDVHKLNGFYYYTVEYMYKNKQYSRKVLRTKDIKLK